MSYLYDVCKRIAFRRIPLPGAEVCNCYIVGYMKKLLFLSFFGLFLLACTTDEGDGAPFVTDVVMPPSSQLFAPGDEVTVAARGFEADDDIMLRIAWPLSQAALPEGYADGVWAVVFRLHPRQPLIKRREILAHHVFPQFRTPFFRKQAQNLLDQTHFCYLWQVGKHQPHITQL